MAENFGGSEAENAPVPVFQALILFGPFDAQILRRRVADNAHAAEIAEDLVAQAAQICRSEIVSHMLDPHRGTLLETSRLLGRRVFTLGVAWMVTSHAAFRNRIVAELLAATAFPDWNRQHFIDTAEMMAAVAIGYDWSKDVMTVRQRETVVEGIARLGLHPGLGSLKGASGWTTAGTNWTLVCSGGLVAAAALLRDDLTDLCAEVLDLALPILQSGLDQFDAGGGWPEGATYGEYGVRYAILAQEALQEAGLMQRKPASRDGWLRHWHFQRAMVGPSGMVFNAGDSLATPERSPVAGWFARRDGGREAAAWQWETPGKPHAFDLLWYNAPPAPESAGSEPRRQVFDAGYAMLRHGSSYLAVRTGRNRTNHAHLDLGSFVLEIGAQRLVCDLGRGDYAAAGYFDPQKRFSHFAAQTRAHNLAFAQEQSLDAKAETIVDEAEEARFAIEVSDPASPFRHLRAFQLDANAAIVADLLTPRDALSPAVTWQCHTQMPVEAVDGAIRFGGPAEGLSARLLSPSGTALTLAPMAGDMPQPIPVTRITATLPVPADGLLVACLFCHDAHRPDLAGLSGWLTRIARARWPDVPAMKRERVDG